jgi:hypothetical protein
MKDLNKFGETAKTSALKGMKQMLNWKCFAPIKTSELIGIKRKWAMESLLFLNEKRDGTIKS